MVSCGAGPRADAGRLLPRLEATRSGRGGAGLWWGGVGTLPKVGEDLANDGEIVDGSDQARTAPTVWTGQDVDGAAPGAEPG